VVRRKEGGPSGEGKHNVPLGRERFKRNNPAKGGNGSEKRQCPPKKKLKKKKNVVGGRRPKCQHETKQNVDRWKVKNPNVGKKRKNSNSPKKLETSKADKSQ